MASLDGDKRAKAIMNEHCERILRKIDDVASSGSEKPPRGLIKRIILEGKKIIPSLTEDMIRQRRKRKEMTRRKAETKEMNRRKDAEEARIARAEETRNAQYLQQQLNIVQPAPSVMPPRSGWVGRKPGSTKKAKEEEALMRSLCIDDLAVSKCHVVAI